MKTCSTCGETKALAEFNKDKQKKDGHHSICRACQKEYHAKWRKGNKDYERERKAKWYEGNKEYRKEKDAKYYQDNKEHKKEYNAKWYQDNKEHRQEYDAKWKRENKGLMNAHSAKRRAAKLQATPAWADLTKIKALYVAAAVESKRWAIHLHVDHIVPLQNGLVCGLHVPDNLQIITAKENLSKNNKYEVA